MGGLILNPSVNASVTFSGGDLTNDIVNPVVLDAQNRVINFGTNPMNLTFTLANGLFQGSVTDTNSSQRFPSRGVILQDQNGAAGYFLGPTQSGGVLLEAP
jgi:hypothetical protein